jgi:hypothetical protein
MRAVLEEYEFCTQNPLFLLLTAVGIEMQICTAEQLALGGSPHCQKQKSKNPERHAYMRRAGKN